MRAQTYGVDATGRAAVTLNLAKAGECEGENEHASTLHVLATNDGFEITAGFETLDRTKAKADTSQGGVTLYVWNDRDLSVKVDNDGANGMRLEFSSAGAAVLVVKCLPTGELGTCTKE
jgi:hypothetical protein